MGYAFYLGDAPLIVIKEPPTHLPAQRSFTFNIEAKAGRLSRVKVTLAQGTKFKIIQDTQLGDGQGEMPAKPGSNQFDLMLEAKKMGLAQGKATLIVQAWGRPVGSFYPGKMSRRDLPVVVDTVPPRVSLTSRTVHVNQGGSGLVLYQLSQDCTSHGVEVGDIKYPGYTPWPDKPQIGLCYFAHEYNQKRTVPFKLWAQDAAGNRVQRTIPVRVRRKRYRRDKITLSTRTVSRLASKISEATSENLPEDIKSFIYINEELRKKNNAVMSQAACNTKPVQYWSGPFLRPRGKPMAGFGERRTYYYQKKPVTKAVHLGIDLADVSQSKIKATARGRVVYAQHGGIYGKCIIIDHGLGVASLYGHLSELMVNTEDMVERGQVIARSGLSGLALGDHLHYSILINGIFVRPTEWWDSHWLRDNILLRFQEASVKAPIYQAAKQPPAAKSQNKQAEAAQAGAAKTSASQ